MILLSASIHTIDQQQRASEELHVFYLNTKNDIIGMELVSKGTLNASLVHPREVFKGALLANANSIMVVHNHPSGNSEPSRADRDVTTKLIEAGNILDINLLNHIILGNNQHYSFFSHGLIPKSPPPPKRARKPRAQSIHLRQ